MAAHDLTTSFNAGELSPQMDARVAVEKYAMGCRLLRNFVNLVHGPITRRPGLEYLGAAQSTTVASRLVGLDFANSSIMMEFAPGVFRWWKGGTLIGSGIAHPFADHEIFEVQTVAVNDVIYLSHANHSPLILEHYADDDFRLRELHEPKSGWTDAPPATPPTGNATREQWKVAARQFGGTVEQPERGMNAAVAWADSHPATSTVAATPAPFGQGKAFPAVIQRVKGWFVPAATGEHQFRFAAANTNTGVRINLETHAYGTGGAKVSVLPVTCARGLSGTSAGYMLTAGLPYYIEFWMLDVAAPAHGRITYQVDGGGFVAIPAERLAAAASAGGQGDSLVGWPALLDENTEDIEIAASATDGDVTLTATGGDVWQPAHVGAWWALAHRRETAYAELVGASTPGSPSVGVAFSGSTTAVRIVGRYEVQSYGIWQGTVHLERLGPTGAWQVERTWVGKKDRNIAVQGTADTESSYRLRVEGGKGYESSTAAAPRFLIEAADAKIYGLVRITGYTSPTSVSARVYASLWSTAATPMWTEGAWSNVQGFPRAACLHEQRTVFGGTLKRPQTLWASVLGDFENFRRSSLDDGSWMRLLASENSHVIQWLVSYDSLVIGTTRGFWVATAPDGGVVTPLAGNFTRRSGAGSAYVPAILANESVVFVQRNGLTLRRLSWREDLSRFGSADLTVLADHLTASGIKQMVWQAEKRSVVWAVTNDGRLLGMTLEEEQNVFAWHAHETPGGQFLSVARINGVESDEVWFVVRRGERIGIERFEPGTYADAATAREGNRWLYSDAGRLLVFEAAATAVSGLDHLEGQTVCLCADGAVQPQQKVVGGTVQLSPAAQVVAVGLAYESLVQKMKLELPMQDGASRSRRFKVSRVALDLLNSGGGQVADSPDARPEAIHYRTAQDAQDAGVPLFTGQKEVTLESRHRDSVDVIVSTDAPLPFTLVGMVVKVDVFGN